MRQFWQSDTQLLLPGLSLLLPFVLWLSGTNSLNCIPSYVAPEVSAWSANSWPEVSLNEMPGTIQVAQPLCRALRVCGLMPSVLSREAYRSPSSFPRGSRSAKGDSVEPSWVRPRHTHNPNVPGLPGSQKCSEVFPFKLLVSLLFAPRVITTSGSLDVYSCWFF